jgi:hypothetical protein
VDLPAEAQIFCQIINLIGPKSNRYYFFFFVDKFCKIALKKLHNKIAGPNSVKLLEYLFFGYKIVAGILTLRKVRDHACQRPKIIN